MSFEAGHPTTFNVHLVYNDFFQGVPAVHVYDFLSFVLGPDGLNATASPGIAVVEGSYAMEPAVTWFKGHGFVVQAGREAWQSASFLSTLVVMGSASRPWRVMGFVKLRRHVVIVQKKAVKNWEYRDVIRLSVAGCLTTPTRLCQTYTTKSTSSIAPPFDAETFEWFPPADIPALKTLVVSQLSTAKKVVRPGHQSIPPVVCPSLPWLQWPSCLPSVVAALQDIALQDQTPEPGQEPSFSVQS